MAGTVTVIFENPSPFRSAFILSIATFTVLDNGPGETHVPQMPQLLMETEFSVLH